MVREGASVVVRDVVGRLAGLFHSLGLQTYILHVLVDIIQDQEFRGAAFQIAVDFLGESHLLQELGLVLKRGGDDMVDSHPHYHARLDLDFFDISLPLHLIAGFQFLLGTLNDIFMKLHD